MTTCGATDALCGVVQARPAPDARKGLEPFAPGGDNAMTMVVLGKLWTDLHVGRGIHCIRNFLAAPVQKLRYQGDGTPVQDLTEAGAWVVSPLSHPLAVGYFCTSNVGVFADVCVRVFVCVPGCCADMRRIEIDLRSRAAFPVPLWQRAFDSPAGDGVYVIPVVALGKLMQWGDDRFSSTQSFLPCELAIDPDLPSLTEGEAGRLRVAVLSLVANAEVNTL